ncbi:MAG: HAD family hydrolase, partial [Gaiellales bacterium]
MFDCDGVLVDSEPHSRRSWLEVLEVYRHPATPSDLDACTGLGFGPTHAALSSMKPLPDPDEVWPRLLHALAQSFDTGLSVFADAVGVLDAAADAGLALGVASASPRSRLDLTLRVAGLADRWAVSVAGDEVDSPKPAPDVYVAALAA